MQLPVDALKDLTGEPVPDLHERGTKRRFHRIGLSKAAQLSHLGSKVVIPVTIFDISAGGVGLYYATSMVAGEQFIIRIGGQNDKIFEAQCVVRRCQRAADKRFQVGAEFMKIINHWPVDTLSRQPYPSPSTPSGN